ncbi:MAG: HXXEE domain-containing protein [Pseudomonadota bacterium]
MIANRISLISMSLFFTILWVPWGQTEFLVDHWMKIGTFLAPVMLFIAFTSRARPRDPILSDTKLMSSVLLAIYLVHQFEEHWIDLLGREYPLHALLNNLLRQYFGENAYGAMTKEAIFIINTSAVWLTGFIAIARSPGHVFPAVAMAAIVLVNGLFHILQGIATGTYNPGLATAVALFVPISLLFYRELISKSIASFQEVVWGIGWAIAAHAFLFAGLLASHVANLIPVTTYYFLLVVWALLPACLFRHRSSSNSIA